MNDNRNRKENTSQQLSVNQSPEDEQRPYTLLAPGPVPIPDSAYDILSDAVWHHRIPAFSQILSETLELLKVVFQTQQPCMMHPSTGSGAMESCIANLFSPGDRVVVVNSGKFGARWAEIARAYQLQVFELEVPWGRACSPRDCDIRFE